MLFLLLISCKKDEKTADKIPVSVTLNSIFLLQYPTTNNGQLWDDFSLYADPYFTITNGQTQSVVFTSSYKDEIAPADGANWTIDFTCLPDEYFVISFYDFDSSANDALIGSFLWSAYLENEGTPDIFTINKNGLQIKMLLSYEF